MYKQTSSAAYQGDDLPLEETSLIVPAQCAASPEKESSTDDADDNSSEAQTLSPTAKDASDSDASLMSAIECIEP